MKNWKRLLALFLSGALALSLFACASGGEGESPSPDPSGDVSGSLDDDPEPTSSIEVDLSKSALEFSAGVSPSDILLTVNGEEIPADRVLYLIAQNCLRYDQYFSYYFGTGIASMGDMAGDLLGTGIDMNIYHAIIRQKAAELGCLLTDDQAAEIQSTMDSGDLSSSASYWDLSDQSLRFIFEMEYYQENLLNAVTQEPDDQELAEYLDAQGLFSVKHILIKTVDDDNQPLDQAVIAEKKALAEDLLSQLQAADDMPAKFDELMHEYSEDGGLQDNPDGYVFSSQDSLVGGFREAALALEEGGLSGLVETDYGYHIMLRQAFTDEQTENYKQQIRLEGLDAQMDQWIEEADIVQSDALTNLDVLDFYTRLGAYQQALTDQQG